MLRAFLGTVLAIGLAQGASAAVLDTLTVDLTSPVETFSNVTLDAGSAYIVTVSGTGFIAQNGTRLPADAEYFTRARRFGTPLDTNNGSEIGLLIDGVDVAWGAYTADHVYRTTVTGNDAALAFLYSDGRYDDNGGFLTVQIAAVPLPASVLMLLAAVGGMVGLKRWRRRAVA